MSGTFFLSKRRMLTISHCEPDHVPILFANCPPPLVRSVLSLTFGASIIL